ncbi:MAG: hypothetical protein WD017_07575 [Cucumibacter sp.]
MTGRRTAAAIALTLLSLGAAPAQQIAQVPARSGVLVTLTPDGQLVFTPGAIVELENGMQLQQDSTGRWFIAGTFVRLRELTANPFLYNGQRLTVTGGFVANVLPDYGFLQYSNLADGGTITVLTRDVPAAALAPYVAACAGFINESIPLCSVAITGTVAVNEADGTVELSDPVFVNR